MRGRGRGGEAEKAAERGGNAPRAAGVGAEGFEGAGHSELFGSCHAATGGLFPVAERRIEEIKAILSHRYTWERRSTHSMLRERQP